MPEPKHNVIHILGCFSAKDAADIIRKNILGIIASLKLRIDNDLRFTEAERASLPLVSHYSFEVRLGCFNNGTKDFDDLYDVAVIHKLKGSLRISHCQLSIKLRYSFAPSLMQGRRTGFHLWK